ncbi:DUF4349 domain-containing protein [Flaviaesturariibacter aridisoli]|uniref:DUF4349 domain-containing protein n=1 Tax=Flaviaesturariibacter aridisoli TaxID=2545761 RepID=A0A4R4E3S7_9BACT|nr:DUF4349 domain-containing protein [Flaviaesturariibacter aridisoli]TCZ72256.1 DUF4349 domain-containing protein [Flaviaesturariibacter aridisoli]
MKPIALAAACALLLVACQSNDHGEPQYRGNTTADSTGYAGAGAAEPPGSKLVKTAALELQVGDVQSGARALTVLAKDMGGALRQQHLSANEGATRRLKQSNDSVLLLHALEPSASLTLRVPAERLDEFLFAAAQVAAFVRGSDFDVDDRTLDYVSAQWRADARRRLLENPATSRKVTATTSALEVRDEEIGQRLEGRSIDEAVRYSIVRVELAQPPLLRREVIVNSDLDSYTPPFGSRLADALARGWGWFAGLLVAGAHLWVFLLVGTLLWIAWRRWGKTGIRVQPAK